MWWQSWISNSIPPVSHDPSEILLIFCWYKKNIIIFIDENRCAACYICRNIIHFTFAFVHLADAFIQSDLQCIQAPQPLRC